MLAPPVLSPAVQHYVPIRGHSAPDCSCRDYGFYGASADALDVASVRIVDEEVESAEFRTSVGARLGG